MSPRFLNVKVVLVKSFARIHETNLKKQGILALTFADPKDYEKIGERDRISISGLTSFTPGVPLRVTVKHADGTTSTFDAKHTFSAEQIAWFKAGSALNLYRWLSPRTIKETFAPPTDYRYPFHS